MDMGRITLAKSVIEAIPVFPMMSAVIPKACPNDIQKILRGFIWGDEEVGLGALIREELTLVFVSAWKHARVADLVEVNGNLNEERIEWLPDDVQLRIWAVLPASVELGEDRCMWPGTGNDNFTVASAYQLLQSDVDNESMHVNWKHVWKECVEGRKSSKSKDDLFWKQRDKTFWYRNGDLNTQFFHANATTRKKNQIVQLEDSHGNVCNSPEGMKLIAKDYFMNLFQQQRGNARWSSTRLIQVSLWTLEDNNALTAPFTMAEFKEAIFSMEADKCSGPDGFNPGFYQHFWDLCGHDIFKSGCSWLECGSFPPEPKFHKYCTYSKRLKLVLDKCISHNQSPFVSGRSILDNAMTTIEIIHFMKSKTRGKKGEAALKLDISKAYDHMDWDFLKDMMIKMGFSQKWIDWIMLCVETVDYSINVNGHMVGPLFPVEDYGKAIRFHRICSSSVQKDYDCFLFFKATVTGANALKNILSVYESASGQAINLQKSEFYCSRNVPAQVREAIANQLGDTQVLGTGGCKWSIGTGEKINIWEQNWINKGLSITTPPNTQMLGNIMKVKDILMTNSKAWDMDKISIQ
ncbi:ribonuclease H [Trifolium pratense]|uniref:Ribonuclease H n=1 Tax=Trifolium pratense TaxID=57577 RepID=A0A2K3NVU2_TRIPR|nr:ribonuclease H [Trifolium pratense]